MRRAWLLLLAVALALLQLSCAVGGGAPQQPSMPAARAGLRPEHRLFYDALKDYGDWVLIEPYGYVFRPDVNTVAWRPFQQGFWVPSEIYGWVWISTEPFGWATYHYGTWLYDRFEGWVWIPGLEWGPAWVTWMESDDYVGWAPLMPEDTYSLVPGGAFSYVPIAQLPSTDVNTRIMHRPDFSDRHAAPVPVVNMAEVGGVRFDRGPRFDFIERHTGPLPRVKIEDLITGLPPGGRQRQAGAGAKDRGGPPESVETMRRAAEEATREARAQVEQGQSAPTRVPVVRPFRPGGEARPEAGEAKRSPGERKRGAPPRVPGGGKGAAADSAGPQGAPPDSTR